MTEEAKKKSIADILVEVDAVESMDGLGRQLQGYLRNPTLAQGYLYDYCQLKRYEGENGFLLSVPAHYFCPNERAGSPDVFFRKVWKESLSYMNDVYGSRVQPGDTYTEEGRELTVIVNRLVTSRGVPETQTYLFMALAPDSPS